jgi:hypothetical protein
MCPVVEMVEVLLPASSAKLPAWLVSWLVT